MIGAAPGKGTSPTLPLRYMAAAATMFVLAALGVPWLATELAGHSYHPRLLALTHTVTLGWITLTIMGATYQLVPIVLERPVWSERLARWQFIAMVGGIVGMVAHFFIGRWSGLVWGAGLVALGVAAHLLDTGLTLRGIQRWTFTARLLVLALAGLALTVAFGFLLGLDHVTKILPAPFFPTIHAHVHLALLGWVLPMVFGVAARTYPMFLLAREPDGWPGRLQLGGLVAGVPLVVIGLLGDSALVAPGALVVAAAVVGHVAWIVGMVRSRKRPALDGGLRLVLTATVFLVLATVLGLAMALGLAGGPRVALAYAVLALGGWASLTIVGMMLKMVPFLVWYQAYGPRVGRVAVPTFSQLSWPAAEGATWGLLTAGMGGLAAAVATAEPLAIRVAGVVLAAGALAFGATMARVLHHMLPCGIRRLAPLPQGRTS